MSPRFDRATARRRFIQFLAASPLFARAAAPGLAQSISTPARLPDPMVEIFGAKYDSPIVIAPTGSNRVFHPDRNPVAAGVLRILGRCAWDRLSH